MISFPLFVIASQEMCLQCYYVHTHNINNEPTSCHYFYLQSTLTNAGIAVKDWLGDRDMNELNFMHGSLITNIKNKSGVWSVGDHRGDKQMSFKRSHIRFLTKKELEYVTELVGWCCNVDYEVAMFKFYLIIFLNYLLLQKRIQCEVGNGITCCGKRVELCLRKDYMVNFSHNEDRDDDVSIVIQPSKLSLKHSRTYQLSCHTSEVRLVLNASLQTLH